MGVILCEFESRPPHSISQEEISKEVSSFFWRTFGELRFFRLNGKQWDSYNIGLAFVVQFKTLLFEYRCDINQAFYVTATPYSIQNHTFTGDPLHKTDIFCHSDLYRTLQEQRPSTKSRKNCRTVLFYGVCSSF